MNIFSGHRLIESEDGYTLLLFVDEAAVEFASEPGSLDEGDGERKKKLEQSVKEYIGQHFKNIKIKTVKLMAGSVLIGTITFGMIPGNIAGAGTVKAAAATIPEVYTVQPGDTLWKISQKYGLSVDKIRQMNNLTGTTIYAGQTIRLREGAAPSGKTVKYSYYTVVAGDTLWKIAQRFGVSVAYLKNVNGLSSDMIMTGQRLIVGEVSGAYHTVKSGDTLWKLAQTYGTTVAAIKSSNGLMTDMLMVGQILFIPGASVSTPAPKPETPAPKPSTPSPVTKWPDVTYIVQAGDTVYSVAKKFGVSQESILRYNYMEPDEWLNAGDKIAISGYAPRTYTVRPGEASAPARVGKLVDWFTEGQYLLKRGDTFTIVDVETGKQFKVTMYGGYNHADVETVTAADTATMQSLFGSWQWTPRAVVIFKDGMNIAASISGMPHDGADNRSNNVSGHFDLYLYNSIPHSSTASQSYLDQHRSMILKAAGR